MHTPFVTIIFFFLAASIFLTSIYIGDIWLGARQPDMFMRHIKLICGATDTEGNDKKRLEFEDSMVSLCKDIYSFLNLHPHFQSSPQTFVNFPILKLKK